MQVRFLWKEDEWREAYLLSTAKVVPGSGTSMNFLIVGLLALGGLGDLLHALRQSVSWSPQKTLLPLLLTGAAVVGLLLYGLQRRRALLGLLPMPVGEQCLLINETGWSHSEESDQVVTLQPWQALRGYRCGQNVLLTFHEDGLSIAAPLRAFSEEQVEWLQRLLARKVKAARTGVSAALLDRAA